MTVARNKTILRTITLLITIFSLSFPAYAQYSGGTGEPNDPYQIATAEDLITLGETPDDYDKHFILTDDIDLASHVFDKAVIAPDMDPNDTQHQFQGFSFIGIFNGNGHTISHLTIHGGDYLGLFGKLGQGFYPPLPTISDLGIVNANIIGSGSYVGGLVGSNQRNVIRCYSTGEVKGYAFVGGLMGSGCNVINCYSHSTVSGDHSVGGLVGFNNVTAIKKSYSTGRINGAGIGGLVGCCSPMKVINSVWDIDTSLLKGSAGGAGLTTNEMMDPYMLGLNGFANDPNWILDAGCDYPRLAWEGASGAIIPEPNIYWLEGQGTIGSPYIIDTAEQLILLSKASILWDKNFVLDADIDLNPTLPGRQVFGQAVIPAFTGIFDGKNHVISNLVIEGGENLGFFGELNGEVKNFGVVNVNINGWGAEIGGLVGRNRGIVSTSYSTGRINGAGLDIGGLIGENENIVNQCYSTCAVSGPRDVGGLVGINDGNIINSYSKGGTSGDSFIGGLVGSQYKGSISYSYSNGLVTRIPYNFSDSGGLLGYLIGDGNANDIISSFWDTETSGWITSAGGMGKTTTEMQTESTFTDAGWDFVGETVNGTEDIWMMPTSVGYPILVWQMNAPLIEDFVEDFESRDFSRFPWHHEGDAFWSVTSTESCRGKYSAQAGLIGDNQKSGLKVTLDCFDGDISFYFKVSCESIFDKLLFFIDGEEQGNWSGVKDWTQVSFPLTAGTRTFEWRYSKDYSGSQNDDTVWIDDIVFPLN